MQFKNPTRDGLSLCSSNEMMDFTSDVSYKDVNNFDAAKATSSNVSVSVSITRFFLVYKFCVALKCEILLRMEQMDC